MDMSKIFEAFFQNGKSNNDKINISDIIGILNGKNLESLFGGDNKDGDLLSSLEKLKERLKGVDLSDIEQVLHNMKSETNSSPKPDMKSTTEQEVNENDYPLVLVKDEEEDEELKTMVIGSDLHNYRYAVIRNKKYKLLIDNVFVFFLGGVSKDNIKVNISNGILTVTGRIHLDISLSELDGYSYSYGVNLSQYFDIEENLLQETTTTYNDGILTVSIPSYLNKDNTQKTSFNIKVE